MSFSYTYMDNIQIKYKYNYVVKHFTILTSQKKLYKIYFSENFDKQWFFCFIITLLL